MSLLFNTLSRLVIAFFPRSKCLLISWLQSLFAVILEPKKIVCHCFHSFPIYLPWSDGAGWHDLHFLNVWVLSQLFHFLFSPSFKRLFTSSLLFAIRVVSSAYLRLLMFLGIRRCICIPGDLFCFLSKILSVQCTSPLSCCWGLSASVGGPMRQEPSWSYPSFLFGVIAFGPQDTLQPGNPERASQPPTRL